MKSRLLTRLESAIRSASSHGTADCLRCERAAYLARHGDFETAASELHAVRQRHQAAPRPSIYAWVNFAEGLVGHYRCLGPEGRDKIERAHVLSRAGALSELQALAAAWLAHLDRLRLDLPGLARHAAEALALAAPDHHAARARAALVVAQSYDEGGRDDLARPWYRQAHWHATAEGDDTALSAMLWKMAVRRVAAWREAEACESLDATRHVQPGRHALASADSAAVFDGMSGVSCRRALQPVLRAQVCTLLGRTGEALALYEAHLEPALEQGMRTLAGVLLADRAWCRLAAGQTDAARVDVVAAAASLSLPGPPGDLAPGHSRLAQVCEACGDASGATAHRRLAAERWAAYRHHQRSLVETLNLALPPPTRDV